MLDSMNQDAQSVAINDDGSVALPSAILDLKVSAANKKGNLIPRMTTAQRLFREVQALILIMKPKSQVQNL
jgi:hypothetical protein